MGKLKQSDISVDAKKLVKGYCETLAERCSRFWDDYLRDIAQEHRESAKFNRGYCEALLDVFEELQEMFGVTAHMAKGARNK